MPSARVGQFEISGADDLMKRLQEFNEAVQLRVIAGAIKKGGQAVVAAARANLGRREGDTGLLSRSLSVVVRRIKRDVSFGSTSTHFRKVGTIIGFVGPRWMVQEVGTSKGGKAKIRMPSKYGHLVEYGAAPHSLAMGVDMKQVRRGTSEFRGIRSQLPAIEAEANRLRINRRELQRQKTRDYILGMDKEAGRRVHPGAQARPFMRPAVMSAKQSVVSIFRQEIAAGIAREVAKIRR